MGLLDRFTQRLTKTRAAISDGLSGLFRGGRTIDQGLLDELEELLYERPRASGRRLTRSWRACTSAAS